MSDVPENMYPCQGSGKTVKPAIVGGREYCPYCFMAVWVTTAGLSTHYLPRPIMTGGGEWPK